MYEEAIALLDSAGIPYTEDVEAGTIIVDIADIDKVELVDIIAQINNAALPFDIDASTITISGLTAEAPEEMAMEEDPQAAAFADFTGEGGLGF